MAIPRRRVDLKQLLPVWAQYALALAVAVTVMTLAWRTGRNASGNPWLTPLFLAIWKWVALTTLIVVILAVLLTIGARRRRDQPRRTRPPPPSAP